VTVAAPFRRVLLAHDFSEGADVAVAHAVELARAEGAALVVVHAFTTTPYAGPDVMIVHAPDAPAMPLRMYLRLQAQRELDALTSRLRADAPALASIEAVLVDGAPEDQIVRLAREGDAIVVGSHGAGGVARWLVGSVAERVARKATVPVLTARRSVAQGVPSRRILVPIDFSEGSRAALGLAARLSSVSGAAVDVLHVWDSPEDPSGDALLVHLPPEERARLAEFLEANARRDMHAFLAGLEGLGRLELNRELATGRPADAIVEAARGYELVAMGTHGRRGLPHLLLGSVAESVVRRAPCAVWTVRA
jgi:nucleotide-binding universal stress UspA family protein